MLEWTNSYGRWVGQLVSFPSSSLPRQTLPWLAHPMQLQQGASFPVLGASDPGPPHSLPGPALLFCPARVQGWWRAGLVFSLSLPWDQLSCLPQVSRGGKWRASFPHPWHCMADEESEVGPDLLPSHPQGARQILSALVCCPGRK